MIPLIVSLVIAFAAFGLVHLCLRLLGVVAGRKGWALIAAGIAPIAYQIHDEYTWFERTGAGLPRTVEVIAVYPLESAFRPWTLIRPAVTRFAAVDHGLTRVNAALPDLKLIVTLLAERNEATLMLTQAVDCGRKKRAELPPDTDYDATARPVTDDWRAMAATDPLYDAVCGTN